MNEIHMLHDHHMFRKVSTITTSLFKVCRPTPYLRVTFKEEGYSPTSSMVYVGNTLMLGMGGTPNLVLDANHLDYAQFREGKS